MEQTHAYECPICLLSLRDPGCLTLVRHRFCSSCINQWVTLIKLFWLTEEKNGKCPVDSVSLSHENIFPDNFTRREVLQTNVKCPQHRLYLSSPNRRDGKAH
ncbi:TNF receptor-associated factor 6 [Orchesella cincta]|uniref:TNF receptor-associated factor 6 n=1 Tax=Orchesella cincta TaxID=48709 RepID=A0A1D2N5Q2_ORCCI|nr:TNF receptor-associated factor 6 [Orchesella cincta]